MNIILIESEIKISEKTFCAFSSEELDIMKRMNLISHKSNVYQLLINHQNYQVVCPLKIEDNKIVGVYLPAFKSPYRPYPCYVYLYAIALNLSSLSMRKSAKETGKKFGINKFSHSTISRVMRLLLEKTDQISEVSINEEEIVKDSKSLPGKPDNCNNKVTYKKDYTKKEILLNSLYQIMENPKSGVKLIYQYFIKYGALLI